MRCARSSRANSEHGHKLPGRGALNTQLSMLRLQRMTWHRCGAERLPTPARWSQGATVGGNHARKRALLRCDRGNIINIARCGRRSRSDAAHTAPAILGDANTVGQGSAGSAGLSACYAAGGHRTSSRRRYLDCSRDALATSANWSGEVANAAGGRRQRYELSLWGCVPASRPASRARRRLLVDSRAHPGLVWARIAQKPPLLVHVRPALRAVRTAGRLAHRSHESESGASCAPRRQPSTS